MITGSFSMNDNNEINGDGLKSLKSTNMVDMNKEISNSNSVPDGSGYHQSQCRLSVNNRVSNSNNDYDPLIHGGSTTQVGPSLSNPATISRVMATYRGGSKGRKMVDSKLKKWHEIEHTTINTLSNELSLIYGSLKIFKTHSASKYDIASWKSMKKYIFYNSLMWILITMFLVLIVGCRWFPILNDNGIICDSTTDSNICENNAISCANNVWYEYISNKACYKECSHYQQKLLFNNMQLISTAQPIVICCVIFCFIVIGMMYCCIICDQHHRVFSIIFTSIATFPLNTLMASFNLFALYTHYQSIILSNGHIHTSCLTVSIDRLHLRSVIMITTITICVVYGASIILFSLRICCRKYESQLCWCIIKCVIIWDKFIIGCWIISIIVELICLSIACFDIIITNHFHKIISKVILILVVSLNILKTIDVFLWPFCCKCLKDQCILYGKSEDKNKDNNFEETLMTGFRHIKQDSILI